MIKNLLIIIVVMALAAIAFADGALQTAGTVPIQGFAPNTHYSGTFTKSYTFTVPAKTLGIRAQCSAACNLYLNGAGVAWPLAAASSEFYALGAGVKSFVFSQTSSASANTVSIQRH